jgi:hypothetical protein
MFFMAVVYGPSMTDAELFDKALEVVGGRKHILAERCNVVPQTISSWRKGNLTDFARARLRSIVNDHEPRAATP